MGGELPYVRVEGHGRKRSSASISQICKHVHFLRRAFDRWLVEETHVGECDQPDGART